MMEAQSGSTVVGKEPQRWLFIVHGKDNSKKCHIITQVSQADQPKTHPPQKQEGSKGKRKSQKDMFLVPRTVFARIEAEEYRADI